MLKKIIAITFLLSSITLSSFFLRAGYFFCPIHHG
nr:MAG TPA: hypothetical protein [Caudoviricetes sp.]